ncbi:MAG TPA: lipopolysaccharide core heptose(I) kinase RfaP [Proteobacteria bacterium]|nr:lipopolysaccharide core heptose(I) kinase RfaP [Pseudomonadota bacterium]
MSQKTTTEIFVIPEAWRQGWLKDDPWQRIMSLSGTVYREKDGRRTLRFTIAGQSYFAKLHQGPGWRLFLKNLLRLKGFNPGAEPEWRAIEWLEKLKIPTTPLVAWGRRGQNPLTRESFVITRELKNTESLEDFCLSWKTNAPDPVLKRRLLSRVAKISGTLHRADMNHCDLYICHFLLELENGQVRNPADPILHLIDLHRVRRHHHLPRRWRIKDLAALYFSSFEIGLTLRDKLRFISLYSRQPWRVALDREAALWRRVEKRAQNFYREYQRRGPR